MPVSDLLRRKVQAAIRELDYHPNHVARSLKTAKTRTLGIIVPDMTIPYFPKLIRGAEAAARRRGYSLIAVNSDDDAERQRDLLSLLRSQRVEGILLVMAAAPTPVNQIARMVEAGVRIVCLDRIPDRVPVDSVSVEDTEAAEMGVNHLIEQGYRRIAIVTGPQTLKNERQRLLGYKLAMDRAGLADRRRLSLVRQSAAGGRCANVPRTRSPTDAGRKPCSAPTARPGSGRCARSAIADYARRRTSRS